MKKLLAIVLALALCLSLAVPVAAQQAGTIPYGEGRDYTVTEPVGSPDEGLAAVGAADPAPAAAQPAVELSKELLNYTYYNRGADTNPNIIPCEANNCLYFTNTASILRYSLATQEYDAVATQPDGSIIDRFVTSDSLYYLVRTGNSYAVHRFDLVKGRYTNVLTLSEDYASYRAVGVDAQGRYYLAATDSEGKKLLVMLNADGAVLSSVAREQELYSFVGFDSQNGNFYTIGYMNYVYWGYNHDMNVVYVGNVTDNTLDYPEKALTMSGQMYYNDFARPAELYADRYLAVDEPIYAAYSVFRVDDFDINGTSLDLAYSASRDNSALKFTDRIGTRSTYIGNDAMVICENDTELVEYSMNGGVESSRVSADHPIFMLLYCAGTVVAIEKENGTYYLQQFDWKMPTKLTVSPSSVTMYTGETLKITPHIDVERESHYIWGMDDASIASVNTLGEVFAWNPGTTTIYVETSNGLSAEVQVTVKDNRDHTVSPYSQTTLSQAKADNQSDNNYTVWSKSVKSYITENDDHTISCINYDSGKVLIDTYTADGATLINSRTIDAELSLFGGCYCGENANFLVFGAPNTEDSDEVEVIRIVRYSKSWQREASASVMGANTNLPFEAGSLRMDEYGGKLYIHTCHEMYTTGDGYNHQANMTFVVDEASCTVLEQISGIMNIGANGYVSHSFNQFIRTDGETVYRVDHGDASPRGVSIVKSDINSKITDTRYTVPMSFGSHPYNYNQTGASIGGMELSSCFVLFVGNIDQDLTDNDATRRVFVTATDKTFASGHTATYILDEPAEGATALTPQLVKIGADQFLVMWEERTYDSSAYSYRYVTKMVTIDCNGCKTLPVVSENMRLSDCQPIFCSDKLVRWYASDGRTTTLYTADPFRIGAPVENVMVGDVDLDEAVTIADATRIERFAAKMCDFDSRTYTGELTAAMRRRADADGDGEITVMDATRIQGYLAKFYSEL